MTAPDEKPMTREDVLARRRDFASAARFGANLLGFAKDFDSAVEAEAARRFPMPERTVVLHALKYPSRTRSHSHSHDNAQDV